MHRTYLCCRVGWRELFWAVILGCLTEGVPSRPCLQHMGHLSPDTCSDVWGCSSGIIAPALGVNVIGLLCVQLQQ